MSSLNSYKLPHSLFLSNFVLSATNFIAFCCCPLSPSLNVLLVAPQKHFFLPCSITVCPDESLYVYSTPAIETCVHFVCINVCVFHRLFSELLTDSAGNVPAAPCSGHRSGRLRCRSPDLASPTGHRRCFIRQLPNCISVPSGIVPRSVVPSSIVPRSIVPRSVVPRSLLQLPRRPGVRAAGLPHLRGNSGI